MMKNLFYSLVSLFFLLQCVAMVMAYEPLYTDSRWIVNGHGERVKLACVNWPSHLEAVLAEGLDKQPLNEISKKIKALGFNCVRFTWPVALPTDHKLASTTIENRFISLNLSEALSGIRLHNPEFLNLSIMEAYQNVVSNLGDNNVMVILDNHVSKPSWCCNITDGNGFFGERYFDPELWLKGLSTMATIFRRTRNVVGMSLRNELRGNSQNIDTWHRYMQRGAETIHKANPHVLVILGGLDFDNDLRFVKHQPIELTYKRKLVYEIHYYASAFKPGWTNANANHVCANFTRTFLSKGGFLLEKGFPLFLSEFGGDQRGTNRNDSRFLNCIFGVIAELDLDWALWTFQGSYYLRQGLKDVDETYGVMNRDWTDVRNSTFIRRLNAIQPQLQGPSSFKGITPHHIIFHPSTGLCVSEKNTSKSLYLGECGGSRTAWLYNSSGKTIKLKDSKLCVQAVGVGKAVSLGTECNNSSSKWEKISESKYHLSAKLFNGVRVCLDNLNGVVVTSPCRCLSEDSECDPASQWFRVVKSQRTLQK